MKKHLTRLAGFVSSFCLLANLSAFARTNSSALTPKSVLSVMQRVADWQLAHPSAPSQNHATGWVQAVRDAGIMALAGISGNVKYRDAMLADGETNHWKLGGRRYDADDQCIGQTWAELYLLYREPKMIAPLRKRFNWVMAHPPKVHSLRFGKKNIERTRENWAWCDSLFMAPPTWARLYAATGNQKYLHFMVTNWWRTTDFLYDQKEHLYFRDNRFFNKREPNGQKVFWSRGNGWVMGGLVRVLQSMPMNYPDRPRFEKIFKQMAGKILACQQPDGLWRASLLDPKDYVEKETSGSGLYTYALAWGINQGLLNRAEFEPAVCKAWAALVSCVNANGKLTHVQPIGAKPGHFAPNSTGAYGVGGFLLAGSEVYRMAVLERSHPIKVRVHNPADFYRQCETVELNLPGKLAVMSGVSSRILASQNYRGTDGKEKLLFQVDLAPHETRTFDVLNASALAAVPPAIVKTYARYVPEREDDFAWESDRIAHRMFGKALETWAKEPLTSSGVDVWVKRTRHLVINEMYRTMKLFNPKGPAQDDYRVGKTRGDGGLGIWKDGTLYVSKNWRHYKIITTGPIRSEFELTYNAWDADGQKVSETKRISIDAGSNLSRVESIFKSDDSSPLQIGVGLAERPGDNVVVKDGSPVIDSWQSSTAKGLVVQNQAEGWLSYWQPKDFAKGTTAVAIVLPKGAVECFTNDLPNAPASAFAAPKHTHGEGQSAVRDLLAIAQAKVGQPFVYYFGAGWSQSGDFPNAKSWMNYIHRFAQRRDQPLVVKIEK